jgi:nucleoside transporter
MNSKIRLKLSVVMFLQYVIWGAWLPLLTRYLTEYMQYQGGANFSGVQAAWIMNTFALASITAMFVGGQLADRYFAAERFLAFSHFVGGVAMLLLPAQKSFWPFFSLMLVHCLFYVPTLSLTNSICFANLKDSQKDFGPVRLWGTIGWIAASTPFVFLLKGKEGAQMGMAMSHIFTVAGIASLALAAFCLSLPSTPPTRNKSQKFAPFEALKLLAVPSILVLFLVTYVDTLVLWCHFFWTSPFLGVLGIPENWMMPIMSIGQVAEIGTMALLGYALKRFGWRKTMILGILGQIVRFGIYSIGNQSLAWLVIASNVIHGVCYAFFFASVYIFVDEHFPKDARTSAQGLFNLLILGVGPLTANPLWGKLGDSFQVSQGGVASYNRLFLVPTVLAIVATAALVLFFHPKEADTQQEKT